MQSGLLLAFCTIVSTELFLRAPVLSVVNRLYKRILPVIKRLLSPRVSDHWKQIASIAYALRMLGVSLLLPLVILLCVLPILAAAWFLSSSFDAAVNLLASYTSLGLMAATSVAYLMVRKFVFS